MQQELITEFKNFQTGLTTRLDTVDGALSKIERRMDNMEASGTRPGGGRSETKSISELLTNTQDFTALKARGRGVVSLMLGKSFFPDELQTKTTITSAAVGSSTPGILTPQRMAGIVKPGVQAFRVRDLILRFPTTSNAIEWVKESSNTNAASPTAETISKPESAIGLTIDSAPVRTLPTWLPASRQVLDDFEQLGSYLNVR